MRNGKRWSKGGWDGNGIVRGGKKGGEMKRETEMEKKEWKAESGGEKEQKK